MSVVIMMLLSLLTSVLVPVNLGTYVIYFGVTLGFLVNSFYLPLFSPSVPGLFSLMDEYGSSLTLMMILVLFFSVLTYYHTTFPLPTPQHRLLWVLICLIGLASTLVFLSSSLIIIYIGYEMSLVPIILIILVWGAYPERLYASLTMLLYTLFFSLPLLVVFAYLWMASEFSLSWGLISGCTTISQNTPILAFSFLLFAAFAVKLPIYGLHGWLPLAHVEAPTFGSMILAGLLLKLGGCGLYRFSSFYIGLFQSVSFFTLGYLFLSMLVASVVVCSQSDLKRLIAYSSVVHMTSVGVLFLIEGNLAFISALVLMVMHGISSPLMFFMVGEIYSTLHTRSLVLIRSLKFYFPLLYLAMIITFYLTVPVPPSLTFLGEILLFMSFLPSGVSVMVLASFYLFLAIVFNLVWLSSFFGSRWPVKVASLTLLSNYISGSLALFGLLSVLLCNSLFF